MAIDAGTGIIVGSAILAAVAVIFRIFDNKGKKANPNSKYLLTERFEEYKEGITKQLETLTDSVVRIEGSIKRLHGRMDDTLRN